MSGLGCRTSRDDMREASKRTFVESRWGAGARAQTFDPAVMDEGRRIYDERDDITLCNSPREATRNAGAPAIATKWISSAAMISQL
jgi:UDPglucose 6-dehydrogenase